MGDQSPDSNSSSGQQGGSPGSNIDKVTTTVEPVRSRWTPKPEQILILESIFNSGMVNPPKDETVRIRRLLEKFGAVGDANVFYWFQNRRSRSRRRQRQMQAGLAGDITRLPSGVPRQAASSAGAGAAPILYEPTLASPSSTSSSNSSGGGGGGVGGGFVFNSPTTISSATTATSSCPNLVGDDGADDLFSISRQMGFPEFGRATPILPYSSNVQDLHYQTGLVTVFINGIPSEVPRGPFDMRSVFGQDVILVHSSGEIVPVNEYGILFQGLQMGENYFLISRPA